MGFPSKKSQISSLYSAGIPWSVHLVRQHRTDIIFDQILFALFVFDFAVNRLGPKSLVHVVELVLHRLLDFLEQAPAPFAARVRLF